MLGRPACETTTLHNMKSRQPQPLPVLPCLLPAGTASPPRTHTQASTHSHQALTRRPGSTPQTAGTVAPRAARTCRPPCLSHPLMRPAHAELWHTAGSAASHARLPQQAPLPALPVTLGVCAMPPACLETPVVLAAPPLWPLQPGTARRSAGAQGNQGRQQTVGVTGRSTEGSTSCTMKPLQ